MHYDVVIVGGGLVGASLACALNDLPLSIALIDAKVPTNNDPRLFGLNDSSCQFLKNIHVWPKLAAVSAPIHEVHVSYQGHFGAVRLKREEIGLQTLGHLVPAYALETALNEKLAQQKNVTLYQPAILKQLAQADQATLTVEANGQLIKIQTPLVIGADGAESTVRELVDIKTNLVDYQQSALVMRTTLQKEHQHIAYERFTKTGAIAMLPLVGKEYATIWTVDNSLLPELKTLSDDAFLVRLQHEFGYKLGKLTGVSTRHHYPLRQMKAEKAVDQHVFLLGNALHALHPIAAQGLNLALYETAVLVDGIRERIKLGEAIHAADLLAMSDVLQTQQSISMGVSHRLSQWFGTSSVLKQMALQWGMVGFDLITPLKRKFMSAMLARSQHVPRLLLDTH
jgi:2-octaprenyl-6-methoxyphenol hydroxylase